MVVTQQYTSPESERAESARGCTKCGQKGHYAKTCPGSAVKVEAPVATSTAPNTKQESLAPAGSTRLLRLDTLRDVNVYPYNGWDTKTSINYHDSHPRNKERWQIWRAPDGWIYVWHDDTRKVTLVGPSNVCFAEPF